MIAAVILAAGLSRRMGQAKLLMLLDGRAIVRHAQASAIAPDSAGRTGQRAFCRMRG